MCLTIAYKILHSLVCTYPSSLCSYHWPPNTGLLEVPRTCEVCFHLRDFALALTSAWNVLPRVCHAWICLFLVSPWMFPLRKILSIARHPRPPAPDSSLLSSQHLPLPEMTTLVFLWSVFLTQCKLRESRYLFCLGAVQLLKLSPVT